MSSREARGPRMSYRDVEILVAQFHIEDAVRLLERGDPDAIKWSSFLQAAAFAIDRQTTAAGRQLSLRQLAFDDEDPAIASEARQHARRYGAPPIHLIDGSSQARTSEATVLTTHRRDVRHLACQVPVPALHIGSGTCFTQLVWQR